MTKFENFQGSLTDEKLVSLTFVKSIWPNSTFKMWFKIFKIQVIIYFHEWHANLPIDYLASTSFKCIHNKSNFITNKPISQLFVPRFWKQIYAKIWFVIMHRLACNIKIFHDGRFLIKIRSRRWGLHTLDGLAELALFSFNPATRPSVRNSSELDGNQLDKP